MTHSTVCPKSLNFDSFRGHPVKKSKQYKTVFMHIHWQSFKGYLLVFAGAVRGPGGYPDPHRGEDSHQPGRRDNQAQHREAYPRLRPALPQGANQARGYPRLI